MKKAVLSIIILSLTSYFNISFAAPTGAQAAAEAARINNIKVQAAAKAEAKELERVRSGCGPNSWKWGCGDDWDIALSIPAIKLRQGEQAKLFEGIAIGLQLNNLVGRTTGSLASGIVFTPALMLATTETVSPGGTTSSDYVLSAAIFIGIAKEGGASFSVGWAYDALSSQPEADYKASQKHSIMFNVGTTL